MRPLAPAAPLGRWASSWPAWGKVPQDGYVLDVLTETESLPAVACDQHGLHALVELVLEESVRLGRPVGHAPLKDWLTELPGEGQPHLAARTLLAMEKG